MKKIITLLLLLSFVVPSMALARVGVGVGTGKVIMDIPLKAGSIYDIPTVTVINTGDETAEYEMDVTYHSDYEGNWPEKEWFEFSPNVFTLEPGKSQTVNVRLSLPVKAEPKDYYAFLEARPTKRPESHGGGASIGIAAAAKLEFSIDPSNVFEALYYRTATFFAINAPWSYIILAVVVVAILGQTFRKKFKFKVKLDIDKK